MLRFDGLPLADAAALAGESLSATRKWFESHGYIIRHDRVCAAGQPYAVQDAIAARRAASPPDKPCWRCGARQGCEHRPVYTR